MQPYLSTDEAAAYLRIKERKLYELVADGEVPCSKVTGKWLFPRAALDRWVESGMARFEPAAPPPILAGSHDPLLEWAARSCGCGLALLAEGSLAGLERLARDQAMIAAIHLHGAEGDDETANPAALAARADLADAVLIGFARREQGLLVAPGNPLGLAGLADAAGKRARFALRQRGAGAQQLLERLLAAGRAGVADLAALPAPFATGADLAAAIRAGEADCGLASRSAARAAGLDFVALVWERFDLALRRRSYFEPGPQRLFELLRSRDFARQAERMGGYDVAGAGAVRLNR